MWARALRRTLSTQHGYRKNPSKGDKVIVAMSGGVDSSVTAKLLADKDYDLSAVFMRNWDTRDESGTDKGCEWEKDWEDVQRVCRKFDIPHRMIDLSREYWLRVFEPSLKSWEMGDTPNPDIWCNKEVKFGALMDHLPVDTQFIATGHYAHKLYHPETHRPQLLRPHDRLKDQTYYLSSISESSLSKTLFPLAHLPKGSVRKIAYDAELHNASRAESMGICFVGEKRRFSDFLSDYLTPNPGPILHLETGRQLGTHQGLWTYTIGQGAKIRGMPERMFVARKDKSTNALWVASINNPALLASSITMNDWSWIWADAPPPNLASRSGFRARMQFRHRMLDVPCTVFSANPSNPRSIHIVFDEPQKAVAHGQIAALWDGEWCLGCGTIEDVGTVDHASFSAVAATATTERPSHS
ncbi:tRNA-specific 2-thiouridylase [Amylostereum chailletii]|nr:tRNA-specific 2-thiouridylase [Amylostereum chailletii]